MSHVQNIKTKNKNFLREAHFLILRAEKNFVQIWYSIWNDVFNHVLGRHKDSLIQLFFSVLQCELMNPWGSEDVEF